MKTLKTQIHEMIEPAAIRYTANWFEKWGWEDESHFYHNIYEYMEMAVEQRTTELRRNPEKEADMFLMNPDLPRIRAITECLFELRQSILCLPSMINSKEGTWKECERPDTDDENIIRAAAESMGVSFQSNENKACIWDSEDQCRIVSNHTEYRLVFDSGTSIEFLVPTNQDVINVLMFGRPPETHGSAIQTRNEFRLAFQILTQPARIVGIESPCLAGPEEGSELSRIRPKVDAETGEKKDWRFLIEEGPEWVQNPMRLMNFWMRLGGINVRTDDKPVDNLVFFNYEKALEIKEFFKKENQINVYEMVSPFSIYSREQAKELAK